MVGASHPPPRRAGVGGEGGLGNRLTRPHPDAPIPGHWRAQEVLTRRGHHRSDGAVDLVGAATAELQGLTLLHLDRDFECIAAVTGQALQRHGPEAGK